MIKALINANIFNYDSIRENCYVLFEEKILKVGPMSKFKGAHLIYDCKGNLLVPALVNCHSHIYSTLARGWNTTFNPKSFVELLEQMWWKLDRALKEEDIYYSGLVSGVELIKNGVTTVVDHHASGGMIKGSLEVLRKALCDDIGLRGIFCFETSERFNLKECIAENLDFSKNQTKNYSGLMGMHACLTLNDEALKEIAEKSGNLPIHIHVGESEEDNILSLEKYGLTPIERLEKFGLLRENSILSHCINISDKDKDILSKYKVFIALNPTSNLNNAVGIADIKGFKDRNVKCLLGNDGLGFNLTREMINLVFAMHLRYKSPTACSIDDLREIIKNNYDYVNNLLGCKLGDIKQGYEADFFTIDYKAPTPINNNNLFGHFFYGIIDNFKPKSLWCKGEVKMKNYEVLKDEEKIYKEASKVAEKLWKRCKE